MSVARVGPYLVGVSAQWATECSCQAKVGQLQVTLAVNEQLLRLQIAVEDLVTVAISDTLYQVGHELSDHGIVQS